jgi:hypothetical protein
MICEEFIGRQERRDSREAPIARARKQRPTAACVPSAAQERVFADATPARAGRDLRLIEMNRKTFRSCIRHDPRHFKCLPGTGDAPWSKGANDPATYRGYVFHVADVDNVPDTGEDELGSPCRQVQLFRTFITSWSLGRRIHF